MESEMCPADLCLRQRSEHESVPSPRPSPHRMRRGGDAEWGLCMNSTPQFKKLML